VGETGRRAPADRYARAARLSIATCALSALGASTCCVLPLVLVSLGVGGAWIGQLRALERFQWVFIALVLALSAGVIAGEPARVTLEVPGMNCPLCPIAVAGALRKQPGVREARADLDTKTAVVVFDPEMTSPERLAKAVSDAGYPATVHASSPCLGTAACSAATAACPAHRNRRTKAAAPELRRRARGAPGRRRGADGRFRPAAAGDRRRDTGRAAGAPATAAGAIDRFRFPPVAASASARNRPNCPEWPCCSTR